MKNLILIIVFLLLCPSLVLAEDRPTSPKTQDKLSIEEWVDNSNKIVYRRFLLIKVFHKALTQAFFLGDDAKNIGLDKKKLTDYLRLKIKNNFANMKFEERPRKKYKPREIGKIRFRVWVTGDNYPVAYHVKCEFWSAWDSEDPDYDYRIWENAVLGYGSRDNVPDTIKKILDEMIEELAILFYKVRGEL